MGGATADGTGNFAERLLTLLDQASVATTYIDTGNITINGGGTPPGDTGELQGFTLDISLTSC